MANETQTTIFDWVKTNFNPDIDSQMEKLREEMKELEIAFNNCDVDNMQEEIVDAAIVLFGLAEMLKLRMQKGINEKMKINRTRTWKMNEKGVAHHV